ncbi:MAG: hypothetical protein ACR2IJ_03565 [Fluviibacter sp.]
MSHFDFDSVDELRFMLNNRSAELSRANLKIIDHYAQAALTGLLAYGYSPRELVVEEAFRIAQLALDERKNHD